MFMGSASAPMGVRVAAAGPSLQRGGAEEAGAGAGSPRVRLRVPQLLMYGLTVNVRINC